MKPVTLAQQILLALGVPDTLVFLAHKKGKSRSHTRKGPGRIHQQGKPKKED